MGAQLANQIQWCKILEMRCFRKKKKIRYAFETFLLQSFKQLFDYVCL